MRCEHQDAVVGRIPHSSISLGCEPAIRALVDDYLPKRTHAHGYVINRDARHELTKSLRRFARVVREEAVRDQQQVPFAARPTLADALLLRLWEAVKGRVYSRHGDESNHYRQCLACGEMGGMCLRHAPECPVPEVAEYVL